MTRLSNIELCRIVSIILVVVLHSAQWTRSELPVENDWYAWSIYLQSFAVVGVNVFVFITGWFSATPKKKSIINLVFICLFYGMLRIVAKYFLGTLELKDFFMVSTGNWFVPCYVGLLFLTPIINSFVNSVPQKQFFGVILTLLLFQSWFGWAPALPNYIDYNGGCSILSFVLIYLFARYFRIYGLPKLLAKCSFPLYIITSLIIGTMTYLQNKYNLPVKLPMFAYTNPLVIFSAICFFASFEKLKIKESKTINYLAKSTLAVLLIHEPQPFHTYMKQSFCFVRDNYFGIERFALWIVSVVTIYIFCTLLDQLRIVSFRPIKKHLL